ncbi:hypothetical protein D7Y25_20815 [Parabacteroides goldsteinii]|nr:hypothetical protein [Parabacteroides goldsteinii]NDO65213.1 hypothetical protein [Parabacteroides goldsteinii]RLT83123.1 hypothetical protein D7Y25_20815 [Parabacteroides goldsteinii]TFU76855.1 hypothetical protein E4T94_02705 [Parabacteroides sp. P14]
MEKLDLINRQQPLDTTRLSPDVSTMYKLRIDSRTMFYFRSKEQRQQFIRRRYCRKLKRFYLHSDDW